MTKWDEIRKEYAATNATLGQLAEKYGVPLGTIKSQKSRDAKAGIEWTRGSPKKDATKPKKDATKSQKVATKPKKDATKPKREKETYENADLTDKQRLFCYYYIQSLNATNAYQKAYKCSRSTAMVNGHHTLKNTKVKAVIDKLKVQQLAEAEINALDILLMYKKIAFADITDFIDFTQVDSFITEIKTVTNDEGKTEEVKEEIPYTYTKFTMHKSEDVDGTLISELSKGKDGMFKVKIADKMKALEFLAKYKDLLNDNERKKLQQKQMQLNIKKTKAEISDMQGTGDEEGVSHIIVSRKETRDEREAEE